MNSYVEDIVLEREIAGTKIRVVGKQGESLKDLYIRLREVCHDFEEIQSIDRALMQVESVFGLTKEERAVKGLNKDYYMVVLSLIKAYNQCKGTSAVAKEWDINTGRPTRIFRATRDSSLKGHFEECEDGGYRFTPKGLRYALKEGIQKILDLMDEK
jgi:hypothetical protein